MYRQMNVTQRTNAVNVIFDDVADQIEELISEHVQTALDQHYTANGIEDQIGSEQWIDNFSKMEKSILIRLNK